MKMSGVFFLQCLCEYLGTWIYFVFIFFKVWTKENPSSCFICPLTFCFIDSTCVARYLLAGAEDKDMTGSSTSLSLTSPTLHNAPSETPPRRTTFCNIFFYGSLHEIREQTERWWRRLWGQTDTWSLNFGELERTIGGRQGASPREINTSAPSLATGRLLTENWGQRRMEEKRVNSQNHCSVLRKLHSHRRHRSDGD